VVALRRKKARKAKRGRPSSVIDAGDRGHLVPPTAQACEPHERWDVTVSEDGTARVWDLVADRLLAVFSDASILQTCQWADGVTLVVTDYRGRAHLLRLEGV
ncbi:MAG: hypothetical protein ABW061_06285, partial [Polyangiaceae bacterium]